MNSYLDHYGADESRRHERRRRLLAGLGVLAVALVVALLLYFQFRDYRQQRRVREFLAELQAKNYQRAYEVWGCTPANPCPNYKPEKFLEDWGPQSPYADAGAADMDLVERCGNGVLVRVKFPKGEPVALVVERETNTLGFAPWPECPGRKWRFKEFFARLFGRG